MKLRTRFNINLDKAAEKIHKLQDILEKSNPEKSKTNMTKISSFV